MSVDANALIGVVGGIVGGAFTGSVAAGVKAKAAKNAAVRAEAAAARVALGSVVSAGSGLRLAWNKPDSAGWNVESAQGLLSEAAGQAKASGDDQVAAAAQAAAAATSEHAAMSALDKLDGLLSAGASR